VSIRSVSPCAVRLAYVSPIATPRCRGKLTLHGNLLLWTAPCGACVRRLPAAPLAVSTDHPKRPSAFRRASYAATLAHIFSVLQRLPLAVAIHPRVLPQKISDARPVVCYTPDRGREWAHGMLHCLIAYELRNPGSRADLHLEQSDLACTALHHSTLPRLHGGLLVEVPPPFLAFLHSRPGRLAERRSQSMPCPANDDLCTACDYFSLCIMAVPRYLQLPSTTRTSALWPQWKRSSDGLREADSRPANISGTRWRGSPAQRDALALKDTIRGAHDGRPRSVSVATVAEHGLVFPKRKNISLCTAFLSR
jgi:hypothetical protein